MKRITLDLIDQFESLNVGHEHIWSDDAIKFQNLVSLRETLKLFISQKRGNGQ